MQKIEIVFDEALEPQVLMLLRQSGIRDYTKLDNVKGVGGAGAKLNTPVGPGINSLLFTVVEDAKVEGFTRAFKRFKEVQGAHPGAVLIVTPVGQFM